MDGSISTATRAALGTSSRSSSSRFATNSALKKLIPVRFPPGRARLATRPNLSGCEDDGDRRSSRLGRQRRSRAGDDDDGNLSANQFVHEYRQPIVLALRPAVFDHDVLALDVDGLLQALAECAQTMRERLG